MTPGMTIREYGRIRLRQMRLDDAQHWSAANPGDGVDAAEAVCREQLAKPDGPGPDKQYVVETLAGEWIGFTGFGAERDGDAGGYFWLAAPFRAQGYGTDMVECVLRVMFEDCGASKCIIDYHDWNTAAARLYAKVGFEEEMRIPIREARLTDEDRRMSPDKQVHAVVVALTRERFLARAGRADG